MTWLKEKLVTSYHLQESKSKQKQRLFPLPPKKFSFPYPFWKIFEIREEKINNEELLKLLYFK